MLCSCSVHEATCLSDLGAAFGNPKIQLDPGLLTSRTELQNLRVTMTKRHMLTAAVDQVACGNLSMCLCVLLAYLEGFK